MISHVLVGTNDLKHAAAFYDKVLAEVGAKRLWESERGIAWGVYREAIELGSKDEGPAGPRGDGAYDAGYFRDLDGNKLSVFFEG
jgi:catechol 2,3-dioxygenase-like lactoylglutathione lyase family enzyme